MAGLPVPPAQIHVEKGPPATAIPQLVEAYAIDLVVLGNAGRGGLQALLVGNTVETVMGVVPCSLLAVRERTAD
jgi:nucleotide-binding universal stress UspA family protein